MVTSVYKWLSISFLISFFSYAASNQQNHPESLRLRRMGWPHPFHVSTTEINHNAADKTLEITCRIFTNDFEAILKKNYNTKVDLSAEKEKEAMNKLVSDYIKKHLQLKADEKAVDLTYLGFEIDNEAVNCYLQIDNIPSVKRIEVVNSILYDLYEDQMSIVHVIIGGNRKSTKLEYPNTQTVFQF